MSNHLKFYIDGAWVDPIEPRSIDVINPATEEPPRRSVSGPRRTSTARSRPRVPPFRPTRTP